MRIYVWACVRRRACVHVFVCRCACMRARMYVDVFVHVLRTLGLLWLGAVDVLARALIMYVYMCRTSGRILDVCTYRHMYIDVFLCHDCVIVHSHMLFVCMYTRTCKCSSQRCICTCVVACTCASLCLNIYVINSACRCAHELTGRTPQPFTMCA